MALVIGNLATLITAISGFVVLVRRNDDVKAEVIDVKAHVHKVEAATNGMKTELVNEVRKASFAQGVKSETDKK